MGIKLTSKLLMKNTPVILYSIDSQSRTCNFRAAENFFILFVILYAKQIREDIFFNYV